MANLVKIRICPTPWPHKLDIYNKVKWLNMDCTSKHPEAVFGVWIMHSWSFSYN